MLSRLLTLKSDSRFFSFIIIMLSTNVLCLWKFGNTWSSATLGSLILGTAWFCYIRNNRKPVEQQDAIVITGCDSGLGYSLALHCYEHLGMQVIAGVHHEKSQGSEELIKLGITVYPIDITQKESIKTFIQLTNERLNTANLVLRSVVNNAGTMIFGEFEWLTDDQIYHQINVNFLGTMRFTKAMMPLIRKHCSRLIIVTSHCASESLPGVATYSATKAGLAAWATALRVELKKYGINVVNFIPGSFMQDSNLLSQQRKQFDMMESAMLQETKEFYAEYFKRYADYLSVLSQTTPLRRINNSQLYEIFNDALLHRYPHSIYKCEPWRYMLYYTLFKITPTCVRDSLVEKFIQMPTWRGKQ